MVRTRCILLLCLILAGFQAHAASFDDIDTRSYPWNHRRSSDVPLSRKLLQAPVVAPVAPVAPGAPAPTSIVINEQPNFSTISIGGYFTCGLQNDNSVWYVDFFIFIF